MEEIVRNWRPTGQTDWKIEQLWKENFLSFLWRQLFFSESFNFFNPFGWWAVSYGHVVKFLPIINLCTNVYLWGLTLTPFVIEYIDLQFEWNIPLAACFVFWAEINHSLKFKSCCNHPILGVSFIRFHNEFTPKRCSGSHNSLRGNTQSTPTFCPLHITSAH